MNIRMGNRDNRGAYQKTWHRKPLRNARPFPFRFSLALFKKIILLSLVLMAGYGLWHWMSHNQDFCLNKILVKGDQHLSHEELLKLTGLTSRINLLNISPKSVEAAIERYPWVKDAVVRRKLPDQLIITIKEHIPIAILDFNNKMYLVDESGDVFKEATPEEAKTLPVITGADPGDIKARSLSGVSLKAIELIRMARHGARILGVNNIKKIHIADSNNLIVYTTDHGISIHFKTQDIKIQFARAEKILFQLYRSGNYEKVASIELDYAQDMAIARLRD
ncbi:MAG: cell division protein FtsQ/DivIB [Dissulfurimicrobium sp.]|uniref:cell division protein FtsQ/DivIB n=1 Tax=Dissulfurimicrobium sp. TaxID=2022436 RepID=UPI00404AFC76